MAVTGVLALNGFGVAFGERGVLRAVDLTLPALGCTVLLGPSGTGKSTLLRTLAGFNGANPSLRSWGSAVYCGQACEGANRPALVMQNPRLLVSDVFENLVCAIPNRSDLTRHMQVDLVRSVLQRYGQASLLDSLSQKVVECPLHVQRVIALLRLVMSEPALLMVDEPTTGLSDAQAQPVLQLLQHMASERSLLVVMHHLQQARALQGHVALLANGQIAEFAASAHFFENPQSDCAKAFLTTGSCPEVSLADIDFSAMADTPLAHSTAEASVEPASAVAPPALPSAASGPRDFLWLMPGQLAGTPRPGVVNDVNYDLGALRQVGITQLISLTEEPFDPALAAAFGIVCLASPVPDMAAPSPAQALLLCSAIDRSLALGEVVAVHCHAGMGRTGTVLAAYWLWRRGGFLGAAQALEDVRRIGPHWVQSQAQVQFLEEFARVIANRPGQCLPVSRPGGVLDIASSATLTQPRPSTKGILNEQFG